jgi:hypothetical protein
VNELSIYGKPTPIEPAISDLMTHQFGKEYLYRHHLVTQIEEQNVRYLQIVLLTSQFFSIEEAAEDEKEEHIIETYQGAGSDA